LNPSRVQPSTYWHKSHMPVCPWLDMTGTYASVSLDGHDWDLCQYVLGWTRLGLMPVCPWLDMTGTYASMSLVGLNCDLCQYVLGWTQLGLMPVCPWLDLTWTYASMSLVGLDLDLCQYVLGWTRLGLMPVCPKDPIMSNQGHTGISPSHVQPRTYWHKLSICCFSTKKTA
jgi:hypothetical protein